MRIKELRLGIRDMHSTSTIRSYKDLRTWQSARELCLEIYKLTLAFPVNEQFGLTSQIRRSSVSVPSNIAEGFGRQTAKEKQQFYHHALGSLFELETQADIARQLSYINKSDFIILEQKFTDSRSLLLALMNANKKKFSNRQSLISNQKDE
jgi:four helix bundle protein